MSVFEFEIKSKSNKQTKLSRANQNVLYFWIRSRACGGVVVYRCQKWPLWNSFMYLRVRACIRMRVWMIYIPFMPVRQWLWASISPMWAWEILSVISNLFNCQTSEQRNIKLLCTHCGGRSSITSQSQPGSTAFSFSSPSFSFSLSSPCPRDAIWGSQQ